MKSLRLLALAVLALMPAHSWADAQGVANLQWLNLQIVPAVGTLAFAGAPDVSSFAEANNSLPDSLQDFDAATFVPIFSDAAVLAGTAHGEVTTLTAGLASGNATVTGPADFHADTTGRGTLFATFMITGGVGPVNVSFAAAISGLTSVLTDALGSAEAEAIFSLQVDGDPVLFFQSQHSAGPDENVSDPFALGLLDSRTLTFGTQYALVVEADAETSATTLAVPEPATFLLLLTPICYALTKRPRTHRRSSS